MELYGLIGKPLSHSLSADYFTRKFANAGELDERAYRNWELERIEDLGELLGRNEGVRGFNVTHPYKESILPLLSSLSERAARIGAVNCVRVESDGRLVGHNTDYEGFAAALGEFLLSERPKALVLGTGGASKAVCAVLEDMGMEYLRVSHSSRGDIGYEALSEAIMDEYRLIINATPVGMHPHDKECPPIPYEWVTPEHFLFDLIYNPATTEFLRRGQLGGAAICNGQKMFVYQAEASWRIFGRM